MKDKKALIVIFAICLLVVAFALHAAFAFHWMVGVLLFGVYGWIWAWASKAVKDGIAKTKSKPQKKDEPR